MRGEARPWLALAVLLLAASLLTACNTVRGFREDVSAAGRSIARTADRITGNN